MAALEVANAALVGLRFFAGTRVWHNILGAAVTPGTVINQALANVLDTAFKSAFATNYGPHFTSTGGLANVSIRDIRAPNLPEFVGTGAVQAGTATGDVLPASNAFVITQRTAKSGPAFRGRCYLSGYTEANNDTNGAALAAVGTQGVAFLQALSTAMSQNGLTLAVVSRPAERVQIVTTTFHADGTTTVETENRAARVGQATAVTSILARNSTWDSQRRRARGTAGSTLLSPLAFADLSEAPKSA